jgi:hypothetical protein
MATTLVLLNFLASSEVKVRLDEVPPRKRSQPGAPLAATVAGELRRGPAAAESAAPPREGARARSGDTSSGAKLNEYSFKDGNSRGFSKSQENAKDIYLGDSRLPSPLCWLSS